VRYQVSQLILYTVFKTRWGYFGLAGNEQGLVRARLPIADKERAKAELLKVGLDGARYERGLFKDLQAKISAYFEGSYVDFHNDIHIFPPDGTTAFRRAVVEACRDVRYGRTISYGELAAKAGYSKAGRAVGGVMANNWWPLVIPCHRVICANGGIGGFSTIGGLKLKKRMLELERNVLEKM
jgi:methylated-DNA-[protein]-cysteine S-methyltransferase